MQLLRDNTVKLELYGSVAILKMTKIRFIEDFRHFLLYTA